MRVLVAQSCLTLCDPMYCSLPGCSIQKFSRQVLLVRMSFHFQGAWCSACYLSDYRAIHEREDGNATSALQGTLRQVETPYIVCMLSHFSCVQLFVTLWIVAHQALLSMGFSRQDYWNALPCPPPRDLPNPRIKRKSYVSCIGRQGLYH